MVNNKKRLVLLDAHAIIHRAYHALPDFATSKGEPTGGLYGVSTMLMKLIADLKPDYLVAAYDLPGPTRRHIAYEGYKAKRPKAEGNLISQLKRSREIFTAFNIPIYDCPGFEADDILGTIVEQVKSQKSKVESGGVEIIIASGDMDTLQLVSGDEVKVFTLRKGISDTIMYNEKKVFERFGFGPKLLPDYKGLAGDQSDNIIGVSGIGEKTATNLIVNFGTIEEIYEKLAKDKNQFEQAGVKLRIIELLKKNEEEALFSKTLATIRTDAPIDFKLPEQSWREAVDLEKVKKIFSELEFRTLGARFEQMMGTKVSTESTAVRPPSVDGSPTTTGETELGIMTWLLDSTKTDPKPEEISGTHQVLLEELKKKNLIKVFEEIEQPLLPVVKKMNERGILLDKDIFKKLSEKYHQRLAELEKKIWELAGVNFNVSSPKQLGEVLFVKLGLKVKNQKKTAKTGAFSTKESELLKLADTHPVISLVLEHRELAKLLGTYIDPLPMLIDKNGRLHTTFIQAGTTTGRMTSREPNLQNIPNKTDIGREIREGFVATADFQLVSFDYSQIELRIAAFLSGDKKLIEIFKAGADVHTAVASQVFNVSLDEVNKEMRRRAKVINFGVMYGMGINALRQQLGTDRKEAQKFYENYFKTFAGLAKYLDETRAAAARTGYTETYFGRRRYFEGLNSKIPFVRAAAERMAINAPIQGTESDIIKIAMTRVAEFLRKEKLTEKVYLLLQVHDELVYEIADDLVKEVAPKIKEIMENVLPLLETKEVPIVVEVATGENWGTIRNFCA
ncbi:MAG: DNA polymerase [Candidatus Paceibacterota bacterium]|jgi:DNA polymerase-1